MRREFHVLPVLEQLEALHPGCDCIVSKPDGRTKACGTKARWVLRGTCGRGHTTAWLMCEQHHTMLVDQLERHPVTSNHGLVEYSWEQL